MLANNCREVRASPEKCPPRQRVQNQGLTQKKLQFLLPSSKQILLVNSSIRYNTLGYSEDPAEKTKPDPPRVPSGTRNKENCPLQTKTSILRIQDPISEGQEHPESTSQMKEKSLKILAQTYNCLMPAATNAVLAKNKVLSSIHFPHYEDKITSLNNILPKEPEAQHKSDHASKQELLARIAKLQTLVHDIISGKVAINRPRSQRKLAESPSKRESIKQLGEKLQRREKRSATWTKDPNAKTNKSLRFEKSKLKIDNAIVERRDEDSKQKSFIIKKKNSNLKLDGYKPIREEPQEKRKDSLNGDGSERPGKLKLRVNFMPNIINL